MIHKYPADSPPIRLTFRTQRKAVPESINGGDRDTLHALPNTLARADAEGGAMQEAEGISKRAPLSERAEN